MDMGTTLPSRFDLLVSQSWPFGLNTDSMLFDCDIVVVSAWCFSEVTSLHDFVVLHTICLPQGACHGGGQKERGNGLAPSDCGP